MKTLLGILLLGLLCAGGTAAGQMPGDQATGEARAGIRLLQFDVSGTGCIGRRCELTLSNGNGLTPNPVVRAPGDRLYVRVFNNTLAELTRARSAPSGQCVTYSTVRVQLNNGRADRNVLFGAQLEGTLFNFIRLTGAPAPVHTVVLVFESESGHEAEGHTSILRLYPQDVQKYFRYAIEVKFTLAGPVYDALAEQMQPTENTGMEQTAASSPSGSGLPSMLATAVHVLSFFWGHKDTPGATPPAMPLPVAMAAAAPALTPGQIKMLLSPDCNRIGPYVPTHASYTISSIAPETVMEPVACGE